MLQLYIYIKTKDICYERVFRYRDDCRVYSFAFLVYKRHEQKSNRQTQRKDRIQMTKTKPILIEILLEELPAIALLKELPNIETKWQDILHIYKLEARFEFYYTPRRLVFYSEAIPTKQPNKTQKYTGAPLDIAYKDGKPTNACISFAKKCDVSIEKLGTKNINGQEVLYFENLKVGLSTHKLVGDMINQLLGTLDFGKSMRWGEGKYNFIRPVCGIVAMIGDENIDISCYGATSNKHTNIHRSISFDSVAFGTIDEYFQVLKQGAVVLDQHKRRKTILKQFEIIAKKEAITIDIDPQLLDEVVAITEHPTALIGKFDEKFLTLPQEVIINSMKEHQRYFACFKQGFITNCFVVVSNAYTDDFTLVLKGNEKVLRPRLSDAMFFYENDIKNGLNYEALKNIKFADGLGSIYDKTMREAKIALCLNKSEELQEAVMLSKADLLSDMVGEFAKLQGIMGYYYTKKLGKNSKICDAIKEQYKPTKEGGELPTTLYGALLSISNRFDTILSMFSINKIPTGSKDPYGLRRAVVAIVRICLKFDIKFDLLKLMNILSPNYKNFDKNLLEQFFYDRYYKLYKNINPSVIKAVLEGQSCDIVSLDKKLTALDMFVKQKQFKENFKTFKRLANIVDENTQDTDINDGLLIEKHEKILVFKLRKVQQNSQDSFEKKLFELFALKVDINNFFDNIKINSDDIKLKTNRQNIANSIYQEFKKIADIKVITV